MGKSIDYTLVALSFIRFLTERNLRPDFTGFEKQTPLGKIVMLRLRIDEFIHLNPAVSKWIDTSTLGRRNARRVLRVLYRHLHVDRQLKALAEKHLWVLVMAETAEFRTLMSNYHSGDNNDAIAISRQQGRR